MKTNRQARLLLIDVRDGYTHTVNISNHKRQYFSKCGTYCRAHKLNIGQARWKRYYRLVKLLGYPETVK